LRQDPAAQPCCNCRWLNTSEQNCSFAIHPPGRFRLQAKEVMCVKFCKI
jgi:hypothetical protein